MVTDSAAVMTKVANASFSTDTHSPDETWIECMVHFLKNTKNHCIAAGNRDGVLQFVVSYFRAMKEIAEDANRGGWNQYLPDGFTLFQKIETWFGTHYVVAERFLKASSKVLIVL